jgi:2-keto-3-deoxy-L-rhamnonate aldolase RhmA
MAAREGTMTQIRNPARERLRRGELALGVGLRQARTVEIAKAMKTSGYDFLFIDLEHNTMSIDTAAQIAVASLDTGIAPIVRVPNGQYSLATRALDGGAMGIIMPHVDSAEEAAEVVRHLRYPPVGHRSITGALPQIDFTSMPLGEATRLLNEEILLVVMLETPGAIARAEEIAAVPGIDVLMIGTSDLSLEMGMPGEVGRPEIVSAYETVLAACKRHGRWGGMGGVYAEDLMARYVGMGMRFILSGNDITFLMAAARQRSAALRKTLPG